MAKKRNATARLNEALSYKDDLQAHSTHGNLSNGEDKHFPHSISARDALLSTAHDVVQELSRRAKGEAYNEHINLSDQLRIMEYAIPIIQQSQDRVELSNLATQSPEERTNTILEAVARGQISVKNAMDIVSVMRALHDMSNPQGEEAGRLIINLSPLPSTEGEMMATPCEAIAKEVSNNCGSRH
jgi:hypothetical protein